MATTYETPIVYTQDAPSVPAGGTQAGQYPLYTFYGSNYLPSRTMYVKDGDTFKIPLSNADGGDGGGTQTSVNYAGTTNAADPDPAEANASQGGNQSNGSLWTHTVNASATPWNDNETKWYFFADSGARTVRVEVALIEISSFTGAANTVNQGSTLVFTLSGLTGLAAPVSGNGAANCLYVTIRDSSGNLVTTTGSSGITWSNAGANGYIGKIQTTSLTNTLTVGASMSTGSYTCRLMHFGGAQNWVTNVDGTTTFSGGLVNNPFYGTANQLASFSFTVNATGTVSGLNLGADYNAGTSLSAVLERNSGTITCDPTTFQPTSSVSNQTGAANAKQRLGGTTNNFSTADLVLSNGQSVDFQMTGPAAYSSHTIGRLTIAEDHDDLRIDTGADPGSGGGTGGATSGDYGLKVTNSDGDQLFGTGFKSNVVILTDTRPALAHNASETFTLPIAASDNTSSKVAIVVVDMFTTTSSTFINWPSWTITRSGNTFTVTNSSGNSRPYRYVAIRI